MRRDLIKNDPAEVEIVQNKVWFDQLIKQTGYKSLDWLSKKSPYSLTSLKRYKSGGQVSRERMGRIAPKEMANRYPGSEKIYYSKIWAILAGQSISKDEAYSEYSELRYLVKGIVLNSTYRNKLFLYSDLSDVDDIIFHLKQFPEFDTLKAIIVTLALARNERNLYYWNKLCGLYNELLPELLFDEDISFKPEFFDLMDQFARRYEYKHALDLTPQYQNWRDQLPRYKQLIRETYAAGIRSHCNFTLLPKTILSEDVLKNIVEWMIDIVWNNEDLKFNARDLWMPLGDFFHDVITGKSKLKSPSESELKKHVKKYISVWRKQKINEEVEHEPWRPLRPDARCCLPGKMYRQFDKGTFRRLGFS